MGWQRFLIHDFFTAQEFDRIEKRLKKSDREERAGERRLSDEVDRLKDDLGRGLFDDFSADRNLSSKGSDIGR